MGTYFQKQAAADRLYKLAACVRVVRRKRSINKYADVNRVAGGNGSSSAVYSPLIGGLAGAAVGALGGLGTAYITKSNRKLRSALIGALLGATAGAGISSVARITRNTRPSDAPGTPRVASPSSNEPKSKLKAQEPPARSDAPGTPRVASPSSNEPKSKLKAQEPPARSVDRSLAELLAFVKNPVPAIPENVSSRLPLPERAVSTPAKSNPSLQEFRARTSADDWNEKTRKFVKYPIPRVSGDASSRASSPKPSISTGTFIKDLRKFGPKRLSTRRSKGLSAKDIQAIRLDRLRNRIDDALEPLSSWSDWYDDYAYNRRRFAGRDVLRGFDAENNQGIFDPNPKKRSIAANTGLHEDLDYYAHDAHLRKRKLDADEKFNAAIEFVTGKSAPTSAGFSSEGVTGAGYDADEDDSIRDAVRLRTSDFLRRKEQFDNARAAIRRGNSIADRIIEAYSKVMPRAARREANAAIRRNEFRSQADAALAPLITPTRGTSNFRNDIEGDWYDRLYVLSNNSIDLKNFEDYQRRHGIGRYSAYPGIRSTMNRHMDNLRRSNSAMESQLIRERANANDQFNSAVQAVTGERGPTIPFCSLDVTPLSPFDDIASIRESDTRMRRKLYNKALSMLSDSPKRSSR